MLTSLQVSEGKKVYCPSCGTEVELFYMLVDGVELPHCFLCGSVIEESASSAPKIKTLDFIMLADDSHLAREVIADKLLEIKAARRVLAYSDGEEFLTNFTASLIEKHAPNLIILDIRMPGINGINAGICARCIEKAFRKTSPTPLLFFSSVVCDDVLKNAMKKLSPARYINKGSGSNPDELADRIVRVISKLLSDRR